MAKLFSIIDIMPRIKKAKSNKHFWENQLRECYDYASPERQTIDEFSAGQKKRIIAHDSTAIEGLETYASRLQAQLVPAWKTWAVLQAGSEIPEESHAEANLYFEKATDILFDHIHHSNFNTQINECFLDLGISTGVLIAEEGDGISSSLRFRSVSLSDVIIERTNTGLVRNVWREFKVPISDITRIWPKAKLTPELERLKAENPVVEVVVTEGVMFDDTKQMFINMVFVEQTDDVLYEVLTRTSPWIVFRESVTSGESYGRGRTIRMLPDIKTLNKLVEYNLRMGALQVGGIFTAIDDGVINPYTVNIEPNTIIPVSSNSRENPSLMPLQAGGDFTPTETRLRDLQNKIRMGYMSQPFGDVSETPVRTATEMSIRNAEHTQAYQSAFGRLQTELLEQLLTRCVDILVDAGKLEELEIDGKVTTIKFTSPIAKAQDAEELQRVMTGIEYMTALGDPEAVKRAYKIEDVPTHIGDLLGIPESLKRSKEDKAALDEVAKRGMQQKGQMMQQEVQQNATRPQ